MSRAAAAVGALHGHVEGSCWPSERPSLLDLAQLAGTGPWVHAALVPPSRQHSTLRAWAGSVWLQREAAAARGRSQPRSPDRMPAQHCCGSAGPPRSSVHVEQRSGSPGGAQAAGQVSRWPTHPRRICPLPAWCLFSSCGGGEGGGRGSLPFPAASLCSSGALDHEDGWLPVAFPGSRAPLESRVAWGPPPVTLGRPQPPK